MSSLEQRVRELEDMQEIQLLKARYCRLSDRGYDRAGDSPGEVAQLFTDDGTWGEVQGRDSIRELFEGFQRSLPFALHLAANPEIEIDGDWARGRWSGVIPTRDAEGIAECFAGVYDDEFVRTPQGWRFERLVFTVIAQY